jgi:hypothetical protein
MVVRNEPHPDHFYARWFRRSAPGSAFSVLVLVLNKPTLRRVHVAGEKLFVDYSGHMMEVVDELSGIRAGSITSSCAFHSSAMRSASAHAGAASRRRAGMRACLPSSSKGKAPRLLRLPGLARAHRSACARSARAPWREGSVGAICKLMNISLEISRIRSRSLQNGVDVHTFRVRECTRTSSAGR